MAISKQNLEFLKQRTPRSSRSILTLGRQHWCVTKTPLKTREYCEKHLKFILGVEEVHSIDIVADDEPTYIHDLNKPLPEELHNRYDVIIDGGTLEHCFNPVQALDNVVKALKIGGVFFSFQLINLTGHGFWQFSPEFLHKWSDSRGLYNSYCEVHRLGPFARIWPVKLNVPTRIEISSVLPLQMQFCAYKHMHIRYDDPVQAGPTTDVNFLRYWLSTVRVWSKRWLQA